MYLMSQIWVLCFHKCFAFNQDIGEWNVSDVTNMDSMFYYCSLFNQDLSELRCILK